jgi:23S rRNA (uracil1939-C5)-methyltransferase
LLREKIGDAMFYFQPQIFRQANLDEFERGIIPKVLQNIPRDSVVAELYSGLGTIGLNAAKISKEVFCSDNNEFVDEVFDKCADSLSEELKEKVFFECMSAEDAVSQGQCDEAEVLIVDPPRKGLDSAVLDLLVDKHAEKKADCN